MARRTGSENSETRQVILDATEELMIAEGYGAVSTRRVATQAGIKPALIQYYFRTMDDLLLAVYRRAGQAALDRQAEALASPDPLHALWRVNTDSQHTALAMEFMALANHRKIIKAEIATLQKRGRAAQVRVLSRVLDGKLNDPELYPPAAVSLLLAAIARALYMEEDLGIKAGHAELRAIVERWLARLETPVPKRPLKKRL